MSSDPRLTTVRESVHVDASPEDAFTFFTARMGEWWPLELASYGGPRAKDIFLEPRIGGRFYERFVDGDELQVGSVIACDPPRRIVFSWSASEWQDETEVEVTFNPVAHGTQVDLIHRGFERIGSVGADVAETFRNGWPRVLAAYAAGSGGAFEDGR
jgi:uncharacterized protein YndB with AHSA1/START domain